MYHVHNTPSAMKIFTEREYKPYLNLPIKWQDGGFAIPSLSPEFINA